MGADGRARWHELWEDQCAVARPGEAAAGVVVSGPNARPYIARWESWGGRPRAVFTDWQASAHRAVLALSAAERQSGAAYRYAAGPYVVIEPGGPDMNPNKRWPGERYEAVIAALPGLTFVQLNAARAMPRLRGARLVDTPTFRAACAILSQATAYVGPEGGLHHAAAALGVPGVVLFGGHISPETTGYPEHRNLAVAGPESPCGRWAECPHCRAAMESISATTVTMHLAGVLAGADPHHRPPVVLGGTA